MLDNFLKIISQVNRTLLTCTYMLSIGVLRTRGLWPRFALHVLTDTIGPFPFHPSLHKVRFAHKWLRCLSSSSPLIARLLAEYSHLHLCFIRCPSLLTVEACIGGYQISHIP